MRTRRCSRCSIGTETCVVGSFYTCSFCDVETPPDKPELGYDIFGLEDYNSYVKDYMTYYKVYVSKIVDERCYQYINKTLPDDIICYPEPKYIEGGFKWEEPRTHRINGGIPKSDYFSDNDILGKLKLCEP